MYLNKYSDWGDAVPWLQMLYKFWTCVEDAKKSLSETGKDLVSQH